MPSLPANGESLTEKVISTLGSEILGNSIASGADGSHSVSPIETPSTPLTHTISPTIALSTATRLSPSNW